MLVVGDPSPLGGYSQLKIIVFDTDTSNHLIIDGVGDFNYTVSTLADSLICFGSVTAEDKTDPTVACKATYQIYLDASEQDTLLADSLVASSSDNCGGLSFSASQTAFDCSDLGNVPVQITATDQGSNTAMCFGIIEVLDTLPPNAACNTPIDVFLIIRAKQHSLHLRSMLAR
ncbi:MAG: hypothetical protein AAF242_01165 [Bacteroidota bacterium]